jgi:hypothetical protein
MFIPRTIREMMLKQGWGFFENGHIKMMFPKWPLYEPGTGISIDVSFLADLRGS